MREALRRARDTAAYPEAGRKLRAVREAAALDYPTADVDEMLEQIERGHVEGDRA